MIRLNYIIYATLMISWTQAILLQNRKDFFEKANLKQDGKNKSTIWKVFNPDDESRSKACILLQGNFKIKVPNGLDDDGEIIVPQDASAEGTCLTLWGDYQDIKLTWSVNHPQSNNMTFNNSLYFGFSSKWESEFSDGKIDSFHYALNTITVVYHGKVDEGSTNVSLMSYSVSDLVLFMTPLNQSYACSSTSSIKDGDLNIFLSDFQIEAFKINSEELFSTGVQCNVEKHGRGVLSYINSILRWILLGTFGTSMTGAILYVIVNCCKERFNFVRYRWLSSSRSSSVLNIQDDFNN